jgi:hypothetical protein
MHFAKAATAIDVSLKGEASAIPAIADLSIMKP